MTCPLDPHAQFVVPKDQSPVPLIIAPDVMSPVRLRRWTAAFFAAIKGAEVPDPVAPLPTNTAD